jgi:hypothetical protein
MFSQTLRKQSLQRIWTFGSEPTLQLRRVMCCGIGCFKACTNSWHAVQVEDQVHARKFSMPDMTKKEIKP